MAGLADPGADRRGASILTAVSGRSPPVARRHGSGKTAGIFGNSGFTLIELMVVLVILGLLAGLVGPQIFGRIDSSKAKVAETQIKMLHGALQVFRLDMGRYPTTAEGLDALIRQPPETTDFWNGPYLEDALPDDPWRTPYRYAYPSSNLPGFALYSLGADSKDGGEGDDADIGYLPEDPQAR